MSRKSQTYGVVGSIITCIIIILILLFTYMTLHMPEEDEGIEVAYGDADFGGGNAGDPTGEQTSPPDIVQPSPTPPPAPSNNDLLTQEDEETIALREQAKQKAREEALERERQRKEQERIEAERREKERLAEEKRKQEQAKTDKANAVVGNLFGNNNSGTGSGTGSSTGSGSTTGDGHEGNPAGKGKTGTGTGNGTGTTGNVAGRRNVLLQKPSYNQNIEGVIIINVRVNEQGTVIDAKRAAGTTISDAALINACINAAKASKFSAGEGEVSGTITYRLNLK